MIYNFVDTNEQYMPEELPKEAVCFNDVWLDTEIDEFQTLHVQGRELLACEVSETDVPMADGVVYKGKRYLPRTIIVTYQIIATDEEAFREAFNKLNQILAVEEAHLIFKDEEDKFFIATKVGNSEVPPGKNCVTGEIEFYCADPFKYSVQEKTVTPTLDGQNTFVVNYEGTYPAKPIFEIDYSADCGYTAFTDASGHILQFGSVEEADDAFTESQHLITDAMGEQPSGWMLNDGYPVGASSITQAGSFKTTTRHAELCLEPESYGQGSQWHGPCYTKSIPADGVGGDGAVNCLYGWTHFLVIEGNEDVGIAQFMMVDGSGHNIAALTFFKLSTCNYSGYYKLTVNGKDVLQRECTLDSLNQLTTWGHGWSYIQKFGDTITFKVGSAVLETFKDSALENVKVKKIGFFLGSYGSNKSIANNGVRRVRFTKHNVDAWIDVPNKFSSGDKLLIDCGSGAVVLNNIQEYGLGSLGNDWEQFELSSGINQIRLFHSSWAQKPTVKLRYREVFI